MKIRDAILILLALVLVNVLVQHFVLRWDLTEDKRYSISGPTKQLLRESEQPIEITILLDGELNSGFLRLKTATKEIVDEFGAYGTVTISKKADAIVAKEMGLTPTVIHERTHKGQTVQTTIYPYAIVRYGEKQAVVNLLKNRRGLRGEENINHSIENLEYAFVEAIRRLKQTKVEKIAFLEGHGELSEHEVYDLTQALAQYYQIDRGVLGTEAGVLDEYEAVIIADPQFVFSETDKYILDQYLMQGGRILWVINGVKFSQDYLSSQGSTPIIALDLNIDDMLFRYGVRVNHGLVQDLQCLPVPVDVSTTPEQPNWQPMPWTYAPLLLTSQQSAITRHVAQVTTTMASAIEMVGGEDGIKKDVLLATSSASKLTAAPAEVDLNFGIDDQQSFRYAFIPVAVSLEGVFQSIYAHSLPPETIKQDAPIIKQSKFTRQVVVATGNSIRNEWQQGKPLPLGYDRYTQTQFGNRDFMINTVLYLADDEAWLTLRQKEITLRLLNDQRARENRLIAQTVSIIIPLLMLVLIGSTILIIRQKKYIK